MLFKQLPISTAANYPTLQPSLTVFSVGCCIHIVAPLPFNTSHTHTHTGPTSRLSQICEWLGDGDYVVVFDECHKAKNCLPKETGEWR